MIRLGLLTAAFAALATAGAEARSLCTIVADAGTGAILVEDGDCRTRVTPTSTFKVALAVMGYDSGILEDAHSPIYEFREGDPDWGRNWRGDVDPAHWMRYSVLWYSQRIAARLGVEALAAYASAFDYGNADFAGDAGKDNALERAWVSSSLTISPFEQVNFMRRLHAGDLPVSRKAIDQTHAILESHDVAGWRLEGKTGSAFPRLADGSFDRDRGWGWYVGWAQKGDRAVAFARLDQDETRTQGPGGVRARAAFLETFPALVAQIGE